MSADLFQAVVVINFFSFVLVLVTSGNTRKFFAKVFGVVFLIFIITILVTVKSGQLQ